MSEADRTRPDEIADQLQNVVDDVIDDADESAESSEPSTDEAELDAARIQRLSSLRRAEYRSRSHAIIAMLLCAVAAAQLALVAWMRVRAIGWTSVPILCVLVVPVAAWGAVHFFRRALAIHQDATGPIQPGEPPDAPAEPDFSALGDGTQGLSKLDDVR